MKNSLFLFLCLDQIFRYATTFNQDIISKDEADDHETKDDGMAQFNNDATEMYFVDDSLSTLVQLNML
jgi:hypothetical protein